MSRMYFFGFLVPQVSLASEVTTLYSCAGADAGTSCTCSPDTCTCTSFVSNPFKTCTCSRQGISCNKELVNVEIVQICADVAPKRFAYKPAEPAFRRDGLNSLRGVLREANQNRVGGDFTADDLRLAFGPGQSSTLRLSRDAENLVRVHVASPLSKFSFHIDLRYMNEEMTMFLKLL